MGAVGAGEEAGFAPPLAEGGDLLESEFFQQGGGLDGVWGLPGEGEEGLASAEGEPVEGVAKEEGADAAALVGTVDGTEIEFSDGVRQRRKGNLEVLEAVEEGLQFVGGEDVVGADGDKFLVGEESAEELVGVGGLPVGLEGRGGNVAAAEFLCGEGYD